MFCDLNMIVAILIPHCFVQVHFLWKRVMGTTVLNATAAASGPLDSDIRVYAHCGAAPSVHAPEPGPNPLGVVLININVTVGTAIRSMPSSVRVLRF